MVHHIGSRFWLTSCFCLFWKYNGIKLNLCQKNIKRSARFSFTCRKFEMPIRFGIDIFHNTKLTIIKFMPALEPIDQYKVNLYRMYQIHIEQIFVRLQNQLDLLFPSIAVVPLWKLTKCGNHFLCGQVQTKFCNGLSQSHKTFAK